MAIRIPFTGKTSKTGQADPPYSGTAPTQDPAPFDQLAGHTAPEPDPGTIRPRVGPPIGQSGRANFYGLPGIDEVNPKLAGVTGLRMFDEMYRTDAHIRRLVLAAWSPITAGTWTLEPYGGEDASDKDRNIAETIWWMLSEWMTPNFHEHLHTLGPMLLRFGFVPFEQLWAPCKHDGKTLLAPRKLDPRLPRTIWRWWQDDFGELTHIGQILPTNPDVVIPATDLTYYRLGGEGDNWQGTSLLRHCYKHWMIKDRLERIDMVGQERKAVGVPIVYHTNDIDVQAIADLEAAVANMHTSEVAYLMVPGRKMGSSGAQGIAGTKEFLIDVIQFDSSSGDSIKESIQYHQTAISASFLTDFLELGHHQVGARATAEVQQDPFLTAVNGVLLPPLLAPLNALVDRIVQVNWGDADGSPTWTLTLHDDASLSEISSYVQQLALAGAINVDADLEDWLRERAGLPSANQEARAQKEEVDQAQREAQLAGAQATAQDPQGLATIKAKAEAGAKIPADGDSEPPNPDKPANAQPGKKTPATSTAKAKPKGKGDGGNPKKPAAAGKQLAQQQNDDGHKENAREADGQASEGTDAYSEEEQNHGESGQRGVSPRASHAHILDNNTPEPSARWFDRLLSQDQLRQAFDGCRDHIETTVGPTALTVARKLAGHAANGTPVTTTAPPPELVDALTQHYTDMYHLGHQTVLSELARQRVKPGKQLDDPNTTTVAGAAAGSRLARARQRGEHSARNIVNQVTEVLGRQQISGLKTPIALQTAAEKAATGQLHVEALTNTASMVNDGRNDAGTTARDVTGAVYTSVMDERSCDPCIAADTGDVLAPEDAIGLGPPNPDCAGGDFCRCTLVWVLSSDPAALG